MPYSPQLAVADHGQIGMREYRLMITAYKEVDIWNDLFSCPHTSTMMTKFLNLGAPVPTPLLNFTFSIGATCRLCGANKFKFKDPL